MVRAFMAKDYHTFDPKILCQNLRGIIFMFTDSLLARPDTHMELPELVKTYQFINFMLGFSALYLKDYPKLLPAVFDVSITIFLMFSPSSMKD
jgi:hypothetical protein